MDSPSGFLTEEMKHKAIGVQSPPFTMEVEKGHIVRFAQAVEDSNPIWTDDVAARKSIHGGIVAMPTFLRAMRPDRPTLPFDVPFHKVLDGGSEWEYFEPVRVGDRITAVVQVTDIRERPGRLGPMLFIATLVTYTNQYGQVVITQKSTLIRY